MRGGQDQLYVDKVDNLDKVSNYLDSKQKVDGFNLKISLPTAHKNFRTQMVSLYNMAN